jgi:hypothetical protein
VKLEDQVCSLELAQKLKELGVKQDSLFYWFRVKNLGLKLEIKAKESLVYSSYSFLRDDIYESYAAFTVAELGEMLPDWFDSGRRQEGDWMCRVFVKCNDITHQAFSETEANARAKMLIYLIENGHVNAGDL